MSLICYFISNIALISPSLCAAVVECLTFLDSTSSECSCLLGKSLAFSSGRSTSDNWVEEVTTRMLLLPSTTTSEYSTMTWYPFYTNGYLYLNGSWPSGSGHGLRIIIISVKLTLDTSGLYQSFWYVNLSIGSFLFFVGLASEASESL